jgi:hypothetical protein
MRASGWKGPFYVPPGAVVQFSLDGFTITRNAQEFRGRTPSHWRFPNGTSTGSYTARYRIGDVNGVPFIINSFTPGVADINAANPNYSAGQPFNGVLYFEGTPGCAARSRRIGRSPS